MDVFKVLVFTLFFIFSLQFSPGVNSQDMRFLSDSAQDDGGIYTPSDVSTPVQSTLQAILTY